MDICGNGKRETPLDITWLSPEAKPRIFHNETRTSHNPIYLNLDVRLISMPALQYYSSLSNEAFA